MISSQLISHNSQLKALPIILSTILLALSEKYFLLSTISHTILLYTEKSQVRFLEKGYSFFRKGLLDFQKTQRPFLAIEPPFFQLEPAFFTSKLFGKIIRAVLEKNHRPSLQKLQLSVSSSAYIEYEISTHAIISCTYDIFFTSVRYKAHV